MRRKIRLAVAVVATVAAAVGVGLVTAAPAQASLTYYRFQLQTRNLCVDVADETYQRNGGKLQAYTCKNVFNQYLRIESTGVGNRYRIRAHVNKGERCVDADNRPWASSVIAIQIWDCLGDGQRNQLWAVDIDDTGRAIFVNDWFGGCLSASTTFQSGWSMWLGPCDAEESQWFVFNAEPKAPQTPMMPPWPGPLNQ